MQVGDYVVSVTPLVEDGVEVGYQIIFKETSPLVRKAMNDPDADANTLLLPFSSLKLVEHFRETMKR